MITVPEVMEAADKIDARLPHPTVADHLPDDLKARLLELAKHVV
jgi:hypothetical protein